MRKSKLNQWRWRQRGVAIGLAAVSSLLFEEAVWGQEALPVIEVGASSTKVDGDRKKIIEDSGKEKIAEALIDPASPQPNPKSTVTPEGIKILGGPAQTNYYRTLDLMPSVIEDSADPYGLSFNRSITVRGVSDFFLAKTYNGLPVSPFASNRIGGADLFDLEDVAGVDLYRGSVQANQGLGFSNAAGVLDIRLLAPQPNFGGQVSQGVGSYGFLRTFARMDSGLLPSGTAFFVSASIASADKWKGEGDARRTNVAWGLTQSLGDAIDVTIYGVHNEQKANNYLGLTYAQVQQLNIHPNPDFNRFLTGVPKIDNKYFDFNQIKFNDNAVFGEIVYRVAPGHTLTLKPYYWSDSGYQLFTAGPGVRLWPIDHYNLGGVAEYKGHFGWGGDLVVGYWGQTTQPEPPPRGRKQFSVTPQGGLSFSKWALLGQFTNHEFHSPYAQYTQTLGATTLTGGLRLQIEGVPRMQYFKTAGLPDVSYNQVFQFNPVPDPNAFVAARTLTEWLPNLGIRQQLTPEWSLNASYSRKIGRPDWGPQASSFLAAEPAFLSKGLNLASLMNGLRPETVDEIDFGPRYQSGTLTIVPTFFGFKTNHKEVLVFDLAVGQSYYQNNETTTGYGAELEVAWKASDQFTLSGSATAQSVTYDHDLVTSAGTTMAIKGKQVAYAPKYMLKGAITYQIDQLTLTPVLRYVSTRQGLPDGSQPVSPYFVGDLTASYDIGSKLGFQSLGLKSLAVNFGALNIFDRRYIGAMSFAETNLAGISYYQASPRTIFAGLNAKF